MSVTALGVLVGVMLLAFLSFAGVCLLRLPRVWRGETLPWLPIDHYRGPRVDHRSFPAFTTWLTLSSVGGTLLALGALFSARPVGAFGFLLVGLAILVVLPVWLSVNAFTRPRSAVPPSRRDEPGWVDRRRTGRARGVRPGPDRASRRGPRCPLPDGEVPVRPYFVARCADDECGWQGDVSMPRRPSAAGG